MADNICTGLEGGHEPDTPDGQHAILTLQIPSHPDFELTVPHAGIGQPCVGSASIHAPDGRTKRAQFHFPFIALHAKGRKVADNPPMIVAYRDDDGAVQEHTAYCDLQVSPEYLMQMLQAWSRALGGVINLRRARQPRVDPQAYIMALQAKYLELKAEPGRTRPPSHRECAYAADWQTEETSRKRLQRARPPTSWEELVAQWDQSEVGQ